MSSIELRIVYDAAYSAQHFGTLVTIYDVATGEVYLRDHLLYGKPHHEDVGLWVGKWVRENITEAWKPWQDHTLTMERKYRTTVISSCGHLRVTESPLLMVTCSPTS